MICRETLTLGFLQVNGYLLYDRHSRRTVIVDPGDEADCVIAAVERLQLQPQLIVLTHAHVDHVRAVGELARKYALSVYLHRDDLALYNSPANALLPWVPVAQNLPAPVLELPPELALGLQVLPTPGHTRGSVCFYQADAGWLFSGDTLFAQSIGRTDLPGGSAPQLLNSIRQQLLILPPATQVFPGHGPATTIAAEIQSNEFLKA